MAGNTTNSPNPTHFGSFGSDPQVQVGFTVSSLFKLVNDATRSAQAKIIQIQGRRSAISIGDMFEMQMLMNHLSQLSEMGTAVVSAANTAILSMARGVK